MKEHYYLEEKSNFGTVEELIDCRASDEIEEDILVRCSNIGTLNKICCIGFIPKIGDKVELFTTNDGWELHKVV